jgi:hypothetical protein
MREKVRICRSERCYNLEFECPKLWSELEKTEDPKLRFCHACQKQVHRCDDPEELEQQREQGHCVAINYYTRPMMGVPLRRLPKED